MGQVVAGTGADLADRRFGVIGHPGLVHDLGYGMGDGLNKRRVVPPAQEGLAIIDHVRIIAAITKPRATCEGDVALAGHVIAVTGLRN